jgi:hypothetical protein
MKNNIREIKTTITGIVVWIITGLYFAMPYFSDRDLWESEHWEVTAGFIIGLGLIIAPDRFLKWAFGWLAKKTK